MKRGTAASWAAANPILSDGEIGFETDTSKIKIGNGTSTWTALNYFPADWTALTGKPAVIAAGSTQEEARTAIGLNDAVNAIKRTVQTITTPTTLGAAERTDYTIYASGITTNGTPTAAVVGDNLANFNIDLLHCDGANNSTTITNNASSGSAWTVNGNAKISTAQSRFGGSSLLLDGNVNSYITPSGFTGSYGFAYDGTGDFTIEMWIYPTTISGSARIIYDTRPGSNGAYQTIYMEASGVIYYYTQTNNRITGPTLGINTWYHIALVRNGYWTRFFVNGINYGTYLDTNSYLTNSARPRIGMNGVFNDSPYAGYIDEIRISRYARYYDNFTPSTTAFPNTVSTPATDGISYAPANPTLPTAVGNTNTYSIKNIYESPITVYTSNSETIDGQSSFLISPGQSFDIRSDGTNWRMV